MEWIAATGMIALVTIFLSVTILTGRNAGGDVGPSTSRARAALPPPTSARDRFLPILIGGVVVAIALGAFAYVTVLDSCASSLLPKR